MVKTDEGTDMKAPNEEVGGIIAQRQDDVNRIFLVARLRLKLDANSPLLSISMQENFSGNASCRWKNSNFRFDHDMSIQTIGEMRS